MNEEKPKKKRVVSRAYYALLRGHYLSKGYLTLFLLVVGGVLYSVASVTGCIVIMDIGLSLFGLLVGRREWNWLIWPFWPLCLLGAGKLLLYLFVRMESRLTGDESVIPFTEQAVNQLPEDETLVRASEEPPAHQGDFLLRAAQGGQETQEEQLLRPATRE